MQDVAISGGKLSSMQIPLPNLHRNIASPGTGVQSTLQSTVQQILQMPRPVDSCVGSISSISLTDVPMT